MNFLDKITDPIFREYCKSEFGDNNGILSQQKCEEVIEISVFDKGIKSLKGIEIFTNLKSLSCSFNKLTSLNISDLTSLTYLNCSFNQIDSLDVKSNTRLNGLHCSNNKLSSLDVKKNKEIGSLTCEYNNLEELDLTYNTKLKCLKCCENKLGKLDLSNNSDLIFLHCKYNHISKLDLKNCIELKKTDLRCDPKIDICWPDKKYQSYGGKSFIKNFIYSISRDGCFIG